MWTWLLASYACLLLLLATFAGLIAVFVPNAHHRADAYRVLKLALGVATGTGGLITAAIKMYEHGILR